MPPAIARMLTSPLGLVSSLLLVVVYHARWAAPINLAKALIDLRWSLYLLLTTGEWP